MKRVIILFAMFVFFTSCQKQHCREDRDKRLAKQFEQYQTQLSNQNLTQAQINEITKRYEQERQKIMDLCK